MGRLDINYIIYIFKKSIFRFIPYKYRKPFILVFSLLGLLAYFRFMLFISTRLFGLPSQYLLSLQSIVRLIISNFQKVLGTQGSLLFGVLFFLIIIYKYTRPIVKNEHNEQNSKREYHAKSLYYEINTIISMSYMIITVLAFLPLFIK